MVDFCETRESEFQQCAKERGTVESGRRMLKLPDLHQTVKEISLVVDPEGLLEDRSEIIARKLTDGHNCRIHLQGKVRTCGEDGLFSP